MPLKIIPAGLKPNDIPALAHPSASREEGALSLAPRGAKRPLLRLADRVFGKPLCITRTKCETILGVLCNRIGLAADAIPMVQYDPGDDDQDMEYCVENGIACISVGGTLVKKASGLDALSGLSSYEALRGQIESAMEDEDVKGICLDVDSPGGEATGCADLCDYIYSARGTKPMFAVCNDQMCSAAYWIGSAADRIYTTRDGMIGSIGVYMLHVDQSARDEMAGLKYTYIQAGANKTDGNSHEPLSNSAEQTMQDEVNRVRDMFVSSVARNRAVSADALLALKADVRFAENSIPLLADRLGTLEDAKRDMRAQLGIFDDDDEEDDDLVDPEKKDPLEMSMGANSTSSMTITGVANGLPFTQIVPLPFSIPPAAQVAAIAPHKSKTSDKPWDGPANEKRLKLNQPGGYYRRAYAWVDSKEDPTKKASYRFAHHEVNTNGEVRAANVAACRAGIGVLNGARGGTTIPAGDRKGVHAHLAKHLKDAGVEPPELKSEAELDAEELLASISKHNLFGKSTREVFQYICKPGQSRWVDIEVMPGQVPLAVRVFGTSEIATDRETGSENGWVTREPVSLEDSRLIRCCVAPYGALSADLGGFREVYQKGCFSEWLASGEDARALFNHNPTNVLGRRSVKTARFYETEAGLWFEAEAPATQWADDLLVSMRRGDISGSSAAFFIRSPRWEYRDGEKVRVIEKAWLVEASVASFPIYEDSTAEVQPAPAQPPAASVPERHPLAAVHELEAARLRLLALR